MAFQRVSKTTQAGQNYKPHFIYVHIIDKMFMKWLPLNFVYQCLHQLSPFYVFGLFLTLVNRSAQISIKQRKFLPLSTIQSLNNNNDNNNNNNSNNNNNKLTDCHCKIKETLFIQELEPAFNFNVGSEKLMLYYSVLVLQFTVKYLLNVGSSPLFLVI